MTISLLLVVTSLPALEPIKKLAPVSVKKFPPAIPPSCPPNIFIGPLFANILVVPLKTASKLSPVRCWEVRIFMPPPSPAAMSDKGPFASRPHA